MSRVTSFKEFNCDECGDYIMKDEDFHFIQDVGKLCMGCADGQDRICECGESKKPDYDLCYNCFQESKDNNY